MSSITDIENAFIAEVKNISGLADSMTYEPQEIPRRLPVVTLLFIGAPQIDFSTGFMEVTYHWRVNLYVSLSDYKKAQDGLKTLVPELMMITRVNPRLSETCAWAEMEDQEEEPVFAENDQWLIKTLHLRAQVEQAG